MDANIRSEFTNQSDLLLASPAVPEDGSGAENWEACYGQVSRCLPAVAARVGLRPEAVEDTLQDVMLEFLKDSEKYRQPEWRDKLPVLLCIRLHDRAVNQIRRRVAHPVESLEALPEEPVACGVSESASQAEANEWREVLALLLEELAKQDPENCELLCRHYLGDESYEALAVERRDSVDAIKCRISRTLKKLRRLAKKYLAGGKLSP